MLRLVVLLRLTPPRALSLSLALALKHPPSVSQTSWTGPARAGTQRGPSRQCHINSERWCTIRLPANQAMFVRESCGLPFPAAGDENENQSSFSSSAR